MDRTLLIAFFSQIRIDVPGNTWWTSDSIWIVRIPHNFRLDFCDSGLWHFGSYFPGCQSSMFLPCAFPIFHISLFLNSRKPKHPATHQNENNWHRKWLSNSSRTLFNLRTQPISSRKHGKHIFARSEKVCPNMMRFRHGASFQFFVIT